jgi:hypothetical protein
MNIVLVILNVCLESKGHGCGWMHETYESEHIQVSIKTVWLNDLRFTIW